ncbi:gamma-interferon-inducible lysosomal thiol reductase [Biomphalaria pfeifferi]|uniref:Gamma-interferon-inducible lysosomal thiol reductase n=1 Tax=Biomphalaria pfeifferi TaxID=112525 RepID=A0AAD8EYY1_BIOPF|nr:gamma-interferon-inducible lysosomal thiol reductase [Biomphalaria pfeifferi]
MARMAQTLVALLFVNLTSQASMLCNVPSKFWCDSPEIALKCGVYEQCYKQQWPVHQDAEVVNFTVYYESLCPDCKNFITTMLFPSFLKIGSIMNLTVVPYGNAREKQVGDHWEFECQHGEQECVGNIIDTCTIALVKNIAVYFPFINCMEASSAKPLDAAKVCATKYPVPLDAILNCSRSSFGNRLEHEMAIQTESLQPQHQYVPWVTLNGVHTEEIQTEAQDNLVKLICDTYKGSKPPGCSESLKTKQLCKKEF